MTPRPQCRACGEATGKGAKRPADRTFACKACEARDASDERVTLGDHGGDGKTLLVRSP